MNCALCTNRDASMVKYYLFKTDIENKKALTELFIQLGVNEKNIVFESDTNGYIKEDKSFYSKLQTFIATFKEELGVNIFFVMSHKVNEISKYCVNKLYGVFPNQVTSLYQATLYLGSHSDAKIEGLLKREFDNVDDVLASTMYAFINNDLNATLTASNLYIHRNTFIYRLNKFIEKTDLDVREFFNASYFLLYFNSRYYK